ncbi:MAG TPA: hypothetical protein VH459_00210 [Gaiellales bacterium]|jgi:hypothetical protein
MGRRTFGIAVLAVVLAGLQPAAAFAACPTFASSNQVMGHVQDTSLNELSDFVASTDNPGVFWTEEDSGNPNKVYAVTGSGQIVGEFTIQGTRDIDWEDLAIDRRPAEPDFLYVGDIGDNKGTRDGSNTTSRSRVRLYRFPEPAVSAAGPKVTGTITQFDTFVYQYADGNGTTIAPRNSESLMVDPTTHAVYVVEKKVQTVGGVKQNWVFRLQTLQNGVINVAKKVAFTTTAKSYVSADISPSGDIALKAGTVAYIWPRTDATVEATMNAHPAAPCTGSPLIASEAVGWAPDGLWTVPDNTVPAPIVRLAFAP